VAAEAASLDSICARRRPNPVVGVGKPAARSN